MKVERRRKKEEMKSKLKKRGCMANTVILVYLVIFVLHEHQLQPLHNRSTICML